MNQNTIEKLQYNELIDILKTYCSSSLGISEAERVRVYKDIKTIKSKLRETTEAKKLLGISNSIGLFGTKNIMSIIDSVEKDAILNEGQLQEVLDFMHGCRKMSRYMSDKEFYAPLLYNISRGLSVDINTIDEIENAIDNGRIATRATTALKNIRRHIENTKELISDGLEKFLKNSKNRMYIQENFITERNGRMTIPIKASYKNQVNGRVIDSNNRTVFIEPSNVKKYTDKLEQLKYEESQEEYMILCALTKLVYDNLFEFKNNMDILGYLDLAFAKGKFSDAIDGTEPKLNSYGQINLKNARHMLLKGDVVPLNVSIGNEYRSLIITGPNAGGKTVVLKTIGLLTMAVQSGFHIPCDIGTEISIFERIFVDIGDDQSIENALSTFSSHVKNLAVCVNKTNKSTLLLFDEIGSGTEPSEGSALAIAILEDVYHKGAITVATTHYNEIKDYAKQHPDFETAAMLFNKETLEPQYKIAVGKSGESNALWISRKMGIYNQILDKAKKYMNEKDYDLKKVDFSSKKEQLDEKEIKYYNYSIGDRVYVKSMNLYGLVYEKADNHNMIKIFNNGEITTLHVRLLTLKAKSENLYPEGYDMEQLFVSFKERKLEKDIKRGSKKVLKQIKKGMEF